MKPIPDKVEIALEYPDKLYIGSFERSSTFDARLDEIGIALTLHHGGDESVRKSVRMHIRYGLFAEILADLAKSIRADLVDEAHREALARAAEALAAALKPGPQNAVLAASGIAQMTADEEVALLHIME
jgi:hypothetical protein